VVVSSERAAPVLDHSVQVLRLIGVTPRFQGRSYDLISWLSLACRPTCRHLEFVALWMSKSHIAAVIDNDARDCGRPCGFSRLISAFPNTPRATRLHANTGNGPVARRWRGQLVVSFAWRKMCKPGQRTSAPRLVRGLDSARQSEWSWQGAGDEHAGGRGDWPPVQCCGNGHQARHSRLGNG